MAKEQARDQGTGELRDVTENDVVLNGVIVGADPDPNIRAQILREAMHAGGSGGGAASSD